MVMFKIKLESLCRGQTRLVYGSLERLKSAQKVTSRVSKHSSIQTGGINNSVIDVTG